MHLIISLLVLKYINVLCVRWYELLYVFGFIKLVEFIFGKNKTNQ